MKPLRIGLTGGLASGKSTVAKLLTSAGFAVIDADALVAELYEPAGLGTKAVAGIFGAKILDPRGGVDKPQLARLIFNDDKTRARVESAIHPLVRSLFQFRAQEKSGPVVLEATRLIEAGFGADFDLILTVEAAPELRLERAVARGMSRDEAIRRLAAQGDGAERRKAAWRVLTNNGSPAELRAAVSAIVAEIHELTE
ncbi:MAG: dephospho-CoA kinase [Thermoanaerobaculia bacterium]